MNEHTCGRCGHPLAPPPKPGPEPSEYCFVYVGPSGSKTTHVVQGDAESALCGAPRPEGKQPKRSDAITSVPPCMACALALRSLGLGTDWTGWVVPLAESVGREYRFNLGPLTVGADRPPHD